MKKSFKWKVDIMSFELSMMRATAAIDDGLRTPIIDEQGFS